MVKLLKKKDIFFNASAITFNLFICAIPFTLLLISIIGYVLSYDAAFNEIMRYGREFFPDFTYQADSGDVFRGAITMEKLLNPLIQQRRIFGIVGFVILIFFSQGLFATVKHVIFTVFEFKDRKHPAVELIHNFFAFGLVGGVFLFFSVSISIFSLVSLNELALPVFNIVVRLNWLYELINFILPITFTFLLFYTILRYLSEKRLEARVALIGALVYTSLFEVAKFGVGLYLGYAFKAYKYFYQGYAILVVIGVWAFYSALLFVISSVVAKAYRETFVKQPLPAENPYTTIS